MSKKIKDVRTGISKITKISYKYLPCINTEYNDSTYWFGRLCDSYKVQVDENCIRVVCSVCVGYITAPGDPDLKKLERANYPKGWALMSQFVDSEGNVFFKGKEQINLKGTLPNTNVEDIQKSLDERAALRKKEKEKLKKKSSSGEKINTKNVQLSKLKKLLKTTQSPKEQQKIVNEIKKLEKELIREN
jgi:hypothetical protein